jgi:hypothetical protein
MRMFKYRALVTLDPPGPGKSGHDYPSGTHSLVVHANRLDDLSCDKYFPAVISTDDEVPLHEGERTVVTVTVSADDAPDFLAAGQPFRIWGETAGHGVVSRRVFTNGEPS